MYVLYIDWQRQRTRQKRGRKTPADVSYVCMYLKRLYVCVIHRLAEAANETEERAQDAS